MYRRVVVSKTVEVLRESVLRKLINSVNTLKYSSRVSQNLDFHISVEDTSITLILKIEGKKGSIHFCIYGNQDRIDYCPPSRNVGPVCSTDFIRKTISDITQVFVNFQVEALRNLILEK